VRKFEHGGKKEKKLLAKKKNEEKKNHSPFPRSQDSFDVGNALVEVEARGVRLAAPRGAVTEQDGRLVVTREPGGGPFLEPAVFAAADVASRGPVARGQRGEDNGDERDLHLVYVGRKKSRLLSGIF